MPVCRLLPHGLYSLIPTILASMALIAGHARDACRFAIIREGVLLDAIFASLDNTEDLTYLEVGLNAYRIPGLKENDLLGLSSRKCLRYPEGIVNVDPIWHVARAASFLSVVLGGGAAFYLWISTCCRFNKSSWRCAAYEMMLACLLQCVAFVWFQSEFCKLNTCELDAGSKSDIVAIILWIIASVSIMVYYPKPPELSEGDGVMASNDLELNEETGATINEQENLPKDDEPGDVEMTTGEETRQEGRRPLEDVQLT